MNARRIDRRSFLKEGTLVALGAAGVMSSQDARAQVAVPNSAGTAAPRLKAPPNACDCHHHIYDAVRFPQPPQATAPCSRMRAWTNTGCSSDGSRRCAVSW